MSRWTHGEPTYGDGYADAKLNILSSPSISTLLALPDETELATVSIAPLGVAVHLQSIVMGVGRAELTEWGNEQGMDSTPFDVVVYVLPDSLVPDSTPEITDRKEADDE